MALTFRNVTRAFRTSRTSAVLAVTTLALTFGVGTALFALVDAVVLTPPPFADPGSLALVGEVPVGSSAPPQPVQWSTFQRWREHARGPMELEGFDSTNFTLTGRGPAERISATAVTPGFFPLLGVSPAIGASWRPQDADVDVTVVSDRFWRVVLESDPAVLGRTIVLNGRPFTVVGVLPHNFAFGLNPSDVWVPLQRMAAVRVLARVRSGMDAAQAALILDEVSRDAIPPARAVARPVTAVIAGSAGTLAPLLLAAAVAALSLATINLAGLLAAGAIERQREFAIRRALGANAGQLATQVLVEAHVLVGAGAAGGMLVALWVMPLLVSMGVSGVGVGWRAMAALALAASACAWVCAIAVAARGVRVSGSELLLRAASPGRRTVVFRSALVAVEVALAVVLLASLALVSRSFQRALAVNPGFQADDVLTAGVSLPRDRYPDAPSVGAFYQRIDAVLAGRLGRRNVALVDELPLDGDSGRTFVGHLTGQRERETVVRAAGPGYFDVMHIPIVEGRGFDEHDDRSSAQRVVISESLARALFGAGTATGSSLWIAASGRAADVVGVVGDVKHRAVDEPWMPTVYLSAWQQPSPTSRFVVRSAGPAQDIVSILRAEVARLDSDVPVYGVRSMAALVDASPGMPARRVMTACLFAFAALALVVAGLGIFGVVADDLARRRFEFALRVALGADPARLRRLVVGRTAAVVVIGVIPGAVLSMASARLLRSALLDTDLADPIAVGGVAATLLLVVAIAVAGPARRLGRTDPALVLRGE